MTKTYGRRRVFDDVELILDTASFHLVVGPNGSGKTTLLRLLTTSVTASSGEVRWGRADGSAITDPVEARRRIGFVGHNPLVYDELTVTENVAFHLRVRGASRDEANLRALEWCRRFGLSSRLRDRADTLSRGLRQRLALAQAFAPRPDFLLLDEPASYLDPAGAQALLAELQEAKGRATILVATHEPDPFRPLADRILEVRDGKLQLWGGAA